MSAKHRHLTRTREIQRRRRAFRTYIREHARVEREYNERQKRLGPLRWANTPREAAEQAVRQWVAHARWIYPRRPAPWWDVPVVPLADLRGGGDLGDPAKVVVRKARVEVRLARRPVDAVDRYDTARMAQELESEIWKQRQLAERDR